MLTILVADDEFAVLEVLSMALASEGHRVLKAGDGADALRLLVGHGCDLVVCDERMPVMDGRQLIDAMLAEPRYARIPVILMAETWGRELPDVPGASCVLGKPVLLAALLREVERLGTSRPAR